MVDTPGMYSLWPITDEERVAVEVLAEPGASAVLHVVDYFGLYQFVGGFGAGKVVDFLETTVFEGHVNPWFERVVGQWVPWPSVQGLFVGEYGVFTLGLRYAIAIILPIVGTFFIAFSILEDSGYLPRLAMLVDRLFKKLGLNGRAVIPIVLGFGCDTMGTMVTRTLETRRWRSCSGSSAATTGRPARGATGTVSRLDPSTPHAGKLLAMGILPGVRVRLVQRFPSYVFQVGRSQFTVDRQLAEQVHLQPDTGPIP